MKAFFFFFFFTCLLAEENFILIDGKTGKKMISQGNGLDQQVSPCCTFKIFLCLIGFEAGLLLDSNTPTLQYKEGYADFLEAWKKPQTPQTWLQTSCVWYSEVLVHCLGNIKLQSSLIFLNYGNQDISGSKPVWLSSSLKISPIEQARFLQRMLSYQLPLSKYCVNQTKKLLFLQTLKNGWKLYGKTGWGGSSNKIAGNELGWFIGWVEKEETFYPFAYQILEPEIDLSQRIPRAVELLSQSIY